MFHASVEKNNAAVMLAARYESRGYIRQGRDHNAQFEPMEAAKNEAWILG